MKIAMPVIETSNKGSIYSSFGRSPYFLIFDSVNNEYHFIKNEAENAVGGAGTKAAQLLIDQKVDTLITYQLGGNAAAILKLSSMIIYQAKDGTIEDNIKGAINEELDILMHIHQSHHGTI
ncbi:MAG: NifB/NifX family molybdenum-iron cluster-binding protein [Bacilli bacterium]|jgi:predicted Fe-Mo cluster-binding NifX family protein|nr:NifB/NifX family molybdenum-iron cluster-binding protein [Bacilli bacterium]